MAGFLKSLFAAGGPRTTGGATKRGDDQYPLVSDDQPRNPYTEVKVLSGHISTVHHIDIIDEKRFISASNDGSAIVWETETGRRLHTLRGGGNDVVTSVLSLQSHSDTSELCIITAYADNTMKFWSLNEDDCQPVGAEFKQVTEHNGLVKCLLQMGNDMVCSGGKDICLWDRNGCLLSQYNRSELIEDNTDVHSLLKLEGTKHFGVVAASDYKSLAVYDVTKSIMTETDQYKLLFVRYLYNSHKDNITCLATLSQNFFASGSRDGVILLWSTNTLSAMKMFSCSDVSPVVQLKEPLPLTTPTAAVNHILALGERYIFIAVGNGFRVYDVLTYEDARGQPKPLATFTNAHQQPITCMDFIEERGILVTASEDHTVRLWGHTARISRDSEIPSPVNEGNTNPSKIHIEDFLGLELNSTRNRKKVSSSLPVRPTLLGELLLHSNQVKVVKNLGEQGLVTCGSDCLILIWKDEEQTREIKDKEIRSCLKGNTVPNE